MGEDEASVLKWSREFVRYWQPRLRLTDWVVEVKLGQPLDDAEKSAWVHWDSGHTYATIYVVADQQSSEYECEASVVHELLHLVSHDVPSHERWRALEQAFNKDEHHDVYGTEEPFLDRLSYILVALRRSTHGDS